MENNTAKHFVLQLGSLISLYLSISFLLVLLFGLINLAFPDVAEGYYALESASSSVRLGIAMVLVFFPTYLLLTRLVNKNRRSTGDSAYLGLTKWLIYLSLLIGGLTLLVDLVVVIMAFLEGELTERFILKAGSVLFIVGAAFYYYLLDARGFWLTEERKSVLFGAAMSVVVAFSLVLGFMNIETPTEVREARLDQKQITDLQTIQYQIESYYTLNENLPADLGDLDMIGQLPEAPENREEYSYAATPNGFSLCATFAEASEPQEAFSMYIDPNAVIKNGSNWSHQAGRYCFERIVSTDTPQVEVDFN